MATTERIPPQDISAERSVLGAMMLNRDAVTEAAEILKPEDFYRETHKIAFDAMLSLADNSIAVDIVTLTDELKKRGQFDKVGGMPFVTDLANAVPTTANLKFHAQIVREKAELRQLLDTAGRIAGAVYEQDDVAEIMDNAEREILSIAGTRDNGGFEAGKSIMLRVFEEINRVYDAHGDITGLPTGFTDLDKLTSGLQASDLILIAARPSMGKTALVLNIAANAVLHGHPVGFFSLEMSKEQLMQRMLCSEGGIDSQQLRTGQITDEDWDRIIKTVDKLNRAPIYIDDTPGITTAELRSRARRLKAEHGLDLIIIDYIQLMQGRGVSSRSAENRQQEISDISRSLKALARELRVPVIALSQLSRAVELRQVKKPILSDLRESGSLEQDADIVMFLYREDYYEHETENQNITEITIAKHRNGPIGQINLFFRREFTRFADISYQDEPPQA